MHGTATYMKAMLFRGLYTLIQKLFLSIPLSYVNCIIIFNNNFCVYSLWFWGKWMVKQHMLPVLDRPAQRRGFQHLMPYCAILKSL